jgi:hypothetical protein
MGEATYYMKARFVVLNEEKKEEIKKFFIEGSRAEDFWQDNRGKEPSWFWKEFSEKFPEVTDYLLSQDGIGNDCNNSLAGLLDFGDEDTIDSQMEFEGNIMRYSAYVWHFANWDPLCGFLIKRFGASICDWLSDEYVNYFDLLQV